MDENQPMQSSQPAPQEPGKSKAGMWIAIVVVIVIIGVVIWMVVK